MYGSFVRAVRESRGMSQAELGEVSGISQPNISAIERDRRVPSAESLNRLLVSCGYMLTAVAGERVVRCELPRVGWFPDEDLPGPVEGDPGDEPPVVGPDTPMADRVRVITAVLETAEQQVRSRR